MSKVKKLNIILESGVIAIMRTESWTADRRRRRDQSRGCERDRGHHDHPGRAGDSRGGQTSLWPRDAFRSRDGTGCRTARSAILAGADFVVAPTLNLEMVELCHRYGVPVVPGCYTPTELLTAWQAGADLLKLFPASIGGPELIKAILAPLPQLAIVPVGGVDLTTAADFIRSGAAALGVGNSLINQKLLDNGDLGELTRRAAAFIEEVRKGRGR